MVKAFMSYSWDDDAHREWVRSLAERLRGDGVETILDQWALVPGDQLPKFMEEAVRQSDYVLIICTARYKERSDNRIGGVGYEGDIMTAEVLNTQNPRKFIPILRQSPWKRAAPSWLLGKYYVDLSETPYSEKKYGDVLTTLLGTREAPPPIGSSAGLRSASLRANDVDTAEATGSFQPLKITGIIVDRIGAPRNDGTRGSALYAVPFRFSNTPPFEWVQIFIESWDHPTRFTSMHRPGIAKVAGDTVILDGTTIEEVEKYHRDTLILATQEANQRYQQLIAAKAIKEEQERKKIADHEEQSREALKRIKFD
ncbi:MAG: toll/interleukin-1 receptor domain-containing protein [Coprothermobacterota bacterium]|nr:toll/interleukin-1 receptor domain-containing protein [Coprothermobacterota bacterium]